MSLDFFFDQLDSEFDVAATPVTGPDFRSVCQRWLEHFCPNVKRQTGTWVYNGYRWHAYSFHHETALTGIHAFKTYRSMPVEAFYIFHESDDVLCDCSAEAWPDLRALDDDIYVFPHTMTWTFMTTHEISSGFGPYFAFPPV